MATTIIGKVGTVYKNEWSATDATYNRLDEVSYQGSTYRVILPTGFVPVGTLPTNETYFKVSARGVDITTLTTKGTFDSLALALAGVPLATRKLGDTVGIKENGNVVEYWWEKVTTNAGLVIKVPSVLTALQSQLSNVFASSATGVNVKNLHGIKDLTIENPVAGKVYSIASVIKNATNTTVSVFSSNDQNGTGSASKGSFIVPNLNESVRLRYVNTTTLEVITLVINTAEIPDGAVYTDMFTGYPLKGSVVKMGNASNDVLGQKINSKLDFNFPFVSANISSEILNSAIKEIYFFGVTKQEIKLTTFQKNDTTKTYLATFWNTGITSTLAQFSLTGEVLTGIRVEPLKTTAGVVNGYMVIDWDAVPNGHTYSGNTSSVFLLSSKIFTLEYSPIIAAKLAEEKTINTGKQLYFDNLIENSEIDDTYGFASSPYANPVFENTEQLSEIVYDGELMNNIIKTTRIVAGNYVGFTLNLGYIKDQIKVGDWIVWGAYVKVKKATTATSITAAIDVIGLATNGWRASYITTNSEWQWLSNKVQVNKLDATIYLQISSDQGGVTDFSKENGMSISASKFMFKVYKDQADIPAKITYTKPYKDSIRNYKVTYLNMLYSKMLAIANYNNDFNFEYAKIDGLSANYIGMYPNFNVPINRDFAYLSTDIFNFGTLNDASTDLSWMKAKAPVLFFNGKRKGCMVLFDENNLAYIIDQTGTKKFITLT